MEATPLVPTPAPAKADDKPKKSMDDYAKEFGVKTESRHVQLLIRCLQDGKYVLSNPTLAGRVAEECAKLMENLSFDGVSALNTIDELAYKGVASPLTLRILLAGRDRAIGETDIKRINNAIETLGKKSDSKGTGISSITGGIVKFFKSNKDESGTAAVPDKDFNLKELVFDKGGFAILGPDTEIHTTDKDTVLDLYILGSMIVSICYNAFGPKKLRGAAKSVKGAGKGGKKVKIGKAGKILLELANEIYNSLATIFAASAEIDVTMNTFSNPFGEATLGFLQKGDLAHLGIFDPKPEHKEKFEAAWLLKEIELNMTVEGRNDSTIDGFLRKSVTVVKEMRKNTTNICLITPKPCSNMLSWSDGESRRILPEMEAIVEAKKRGEIISLARFVLFSLAKYKLACGSKSTIAEDALFKKYSEEIAALKGETDIGEIGAGNIEETSPLEGPLLLEGEDGFVSAVVAGASSSLESNVGASSVSDEMAGPLESADEDDEESGAGADLFQ